MVFLTMMKNAMMVILKAVMAAINYVNKSTNLSVYKNLDLKNQLAHMMLRKIQKVMQKLTYQELVQY